MSEPTIEQSQPVVEQQVVKEIKQEDANLFRTKAVLVYLDSPVYDFSATEISFPQNPVPVYSEDREKHLGFATLYLDTRGGIQRIVAEIITDYATEERLLIETGEIRLYPRFYGRQGFRAQAMFDFTKPLEVFTLTVDGIILSTAKPADTRIAPLGTPVL